MLNLHIVRNSVTRDSRILKETKSLRNSMLFENVEICGFANDNDLLDEVIEESKVKRIAIKTRKLPKNIISQLIKYLEWHLRVVSHYRKTPMNVIHCHDLAPLPIAVHLKRITGARLIYDAHELESERNGLHGIRQIISRKLEKILIPYVDQVISVSPSIVHWYKSNFPSRNVNLVRNIPENSVINNPEKVSLKFQLGVPIDSVLFLYLGGYTSGRGIETILKAFQVDAVKHHVVFMGYGPLEKQIKIAQESCNRIHTLDPVRPNEVINYIRGADVGLCLIEDTCLSYRYCLPNKLFESLLAGIPVLASNLPDQAEIVKKYEGGWVVENNLSEITKFLREVKFVDVKSRSDGLLDRVSCLTWDNEAKILLKCYANLLTI